MTAPDDFGVHDSNPWKRKARLWIEVNGSEGSLAFNSESPNELWIGRRDRASELLPKDPSL